MEKAPLLSIEFARISNDGRHTSVIVPEIKEAIQTLYAFSKYQNSDEAILDLAVREGCGEIRLAFVKRRTTIFK